MKRHDYKGWKPLKFFKPKNIVFDDGSENTSQKKAT